MIQPYRFAVRETGIYFHNGVPYSVRPTDVLKLTGGTSDAFYCTVIRGGECVVDGVEIPTADICPVRHTCLDVVAA